MGDLEVEGRSVVHPLGVGRGGPVRESAGCMPKKHY